MKVYEMMNGKVKAHPVWTMAHPSMTSIVMHDTLTAIFGHYAMSMKCLHCCLLRSTIDAVPDQCLGLCVCDKRLFIARRTNKQNFFYQSFSFSLTHPYSLANVCIYRSIASILFNNETERSFYYPCAVWIQKFPQILVHNKIAMRCCSELITNEINDQNVSFTFFFGNIFHEKCKKLHENW